MLHNAATKARVATIRLLLEVGADVVAQDNEGQTPLHYIACNGHSWAKLGRPNDYLKDISFYREFKQKISQE